MKKRGITLFALLITIVVAIIIVAASIISVGNVVENNRISNFTETLQAIEEQVGLYYIQNNGLPKENDTIYNKHDVIALANSYSEDNVSSILEEEFSLNYDNTASAFYKLDLKKIDVTRSGENDLYVFAVPSLHVYSLKGLEAKNKIYFSLSSRLNASKTLRQNISNYSESTIVSAATGLKVSQKMSKWSNKLGITIESFVENGEKLYINFNEKDVLINTTENKQNLISFDSLVKTDNNGLNASDFSESAFDESDMILLSSLDVKQKYIKVVKKDSSNNIVASTNVYLTNFDYIAPSVENLNNKVIVGNDKNTLEFYVLDTQSGIKEVRYEYFSTYDRNDGNVGKKAYYSLDKLTRNYLLYNGKVVKPDESGKITLEIPKGISSIKAIIVDNALNMSDAIELGTEGEKEIYYSLSSIENGNVQIKFYGNNLASGNYSYSLDNLSYSENLGFNPSQTVTISNINYNNKKLYIKVTSEELKRLIEIDLPIIETNGTNVKNESSTYNPYVPAGFIHIEGSVSEGFVIQDVSENSSTKYNEFVWIPVDGKNVKYGKTEFGLGTIASFQNVLIDNKDSFLETSNFEEQIKQSVLRYGGFYVARYEASYDLASNLRSIKDATPVTNISYQDALSKSNTMYQNRNDMATTIMNAACYDAIMKYLSHSKYNVTAVSDYNTLLGNFSGSIIKTGSNNNYALNNIYDICGNVSELTSETYKGNPVFRGGSYSSTGENRVGASRAYNGETVTLPTIGFRAIMFIK